MGLVFEADLFRGRHGLVLSPELFIASECRSLGFRELEFRVRELYGDLGLGLGWDLWSLGLVS